MSSLARRTLRATAAVAGITAAGVGLAGPALAAPAPAPEKPSTDGAAPAPGTDDAPKLLGDVRRPAPTPAELPQLFTVDDTSVYTADHAGPTLPTADELPADRLPSPGDAVHFGDSEEGRDADLQFQAAAPQERDSALQQLDTTSMFGQVLGATEGNEVHA